MAEEVPGPRRPARPPGGPAGAPGAGPGPAGNSAAGGPGGTGGGPSASAPPAEPKEPGKAGEAGEQRLSGVDLARVALRAAKERARERGTGSRQTGVPRRGGRRSAAGADGRDPLPLAAALERLTAERGWELPLAVGGVMGRWPEIVGATNAEHWRPEHFDEESRTLTVRCDSTAWATQLRLLAPQVLARLNQDLGRGAVKLIRVTGPGGPGGPGRGAGGGGGGRWRAPGSRGPGDTYG
ncbi:DUF721 domain-containing protein [Streptomyces sp. YIM 98790]|uniref:DUF721 domain-containing protein n=1 Tax=Streptomyces sp. YIM 98790 TaxID=2689077 RepID=UPI001408170F|nr:DciA family protein [Streptomyces sp. YIM 98790]